MALRAPTARPLGLGITNGLAQPMLLGGRLALWLQSDLIATRRLNEYAVRHCCATPVASEPSFLR
jgi:hypothetical protein